MPDLKGAKKAERAGGASNATATGKANSSPLRNLKHGKPANEQPDKARTIPCVRCHAHSSVFYCDVCLSERIVSHHVNVRRVGEMRNESETSVKRYFGLANETPTSRGETQRRLLAKRAKLEHVINDVRSANEQARRRNAEGAIEIEDRRAAYERRKQSLRRAREIQEERFDIDLLRKDVKELRSMSQVIGSKLAETRAVLSREVLSLFQVEPPVGTMSTVHTNARTSRPPRDREGYVPGAFLQSRQASRTTRGGDDTPARVNPDDWTIMHMPLVLPSDVKRFERGKVNGAIIHTIHLLHLLAYYLGIALPFVLTITQGMPLIRPNPVWGSGTKQTLHLSSSTYAAFPSPPSKEVKSGQTIGHMGASMISSLGASTMSTLESFVHLPTGANLPWAKNMPSTSIGAPNEVKNSSNSDEGNEKRSNAVKQFYTACTMLAFDIAYLVSAEGVKVDLLSAAACPLRLLHKAICSPLLGKKAHTTSSAPNHIDNLLFSHFEFAQLAQLYEPGTAVHGGTTLRQASGAESKLRKVDKTIAKATSGHGTTTSKIDLIVEGSYIDARQAAQSVLLPNDKASLPALKGGAQAGRINTTSRQAESKAAKGTSASTAPLLKASKAKTEATSSTTSRPGTLDFLRTTTTTPTLDVDTVKQAGIRDRVGATGKESSKDALSSMRSGHLSATASRITSGTVMFNGREVRATTLADKARRSSATGSKQSRPSGGEEDGWALL